MPRSYLARLYPSLTMNVPVAPALAVPSLTVTVPNGVAEGQLIETRTPDGQQVQVAVPAGCAPGSQFVVAYTPKPTQDDGDQGDLRTTLLESVRRRRAEKMAPYHDLLQQNNSLRAKVSELQEQARMNDWFLTRLTSLHEAAMDEAEEKWRILQKGRIAAPFRGTLITEEDRVVWHIQDASTQILASGAAWFSSPFEASGVLLQLELRFLAPSQVTAEQGQDRGDCVLALKGDPGLFLVCRLYVGGAFAQVEHTFDGEGQAVSTKRFQIRDYVDEEGSLVIGVEVVEVQKNWSSLGGDAL